jgi:hypothetical protein
MKNAARAAGARVKGPRLFAGAKATETFPRACG